MSIYLEFEKDNGAKIALSLKEAKQLYQDLHELFNNASVPIRKDYVPPIIPNFDIINCNGNGNIASEN